MTDNVKSGETATLTWANPGFDSTPTLTITNNQTLAAEAVVPDFVVYDEGSYVALWTTSSTQAQGSYTARLAGLVLGVASAVNCTVYVTTQDCYLTVAEFKSRVMPSVNTSKDAEIARLLCGVSNSIRIECGRTFSYGATVQSRYYNPFRTMINDECGYARLLVDDVAVSDGFKLYEGTRTAGGEWVEISSDYYELERPDDDFPYSVVTLFNPRVLVGPILRCDAHWGWESVPPNIAEAVLLQANRIYSRKGSPEGVAGPAEWGLVTQPRLDLDVKNLLAGYKRVTFA